MAKGLAGLLAEIRACRRCVEAPIGAPLGHQPRPVIRAAVTARVAICGQAPGTRVHDSGVPFLDPSGDRLRAWMGVTSDEFYDERLVAIVPMGFCFPGLDAHGSDLPPRRECAPLWRARVLEALPRVELMLLVGSYAQRWHLPEARRASMTEVVHGWRHSPSGPESPGCYRCLIHPGATMPGSSATHGSRPNFCRCCACRYARRLAVAGYPEQSSQLGSRVSANVGFIRDTTLKFRVSSFRKSLFACRAGTSAPHSFVPGRFSDRDVHRLRAIKALPAAERAAHGRSAAAGARHMTRRGRT